jgi:mannose-1-phosphate guanylyltransferase
MSKSENLYSIILASGEDRRLKPLTDVLSGADMPKQFAWIAGGGSLLQQTVARYVGVVPAERTVVVVSSAHAAAARTQLRAWPGIEIIARPAECRAGLDLLLALGCVFSRAPDARVVVTSADHYVPNTSGFAQSILAADKAAGQAGAVLIGVADGHRRGRRAWIVPGRPLAGDALAVAGLVDWASPVQSAELAASGALWNSSTVVARAEKLWYLAARQLPMQTEAVARLWAGRGSLAEAVGTEGLDMPAVDLSGALLRGTKDLATIAVHGSGWTDWTSSEHVLDSIEDPIELERLLARILRRQQAAGRTELHPAIPAVLHHANAA